MTMQAQPSPATLADFLRARIDEDERVARAAHPTLHGDMPPRWLLMEHVATFDPARVLAECEAKRMILAMVGDPGEPDGSGEQWLMSQTLRMLALPYADHPDYRPEWKPSS